MNGNSHDMHYNGYILQVRKIALFDENTVLTSGARGIVYPSDLKSLIYGEDLTGEVNITNYHTNYH